jgi:glycerol kinase
MKKFILAIDQGTTGSRAFIFDAKGKAVASSYQEFRQYYPRPGWVEHDADEIWLSCRRVIKDAVKKAGINPQEITAIGITNQRETTVVWDRATGKPLYRAIVWQCRRTAAMCQKPDMQKARKIIRNKTGLVLDPYFSGTKLRWLLDNVSGIRTKAKKGEAAFGTIDSWLIWKLTGGRSHATDMTNASRTMLYNIQTKQWDNELLKLFKIPPSVLPQVFFSGDDFGKTIPVAGLPPGIPIKAVMGDQQAALYGQGCFSPGSIKNTYGTGCFMMLNTGKKLISSQKGLLTTLACDVHGHAVYALEGSVFIAGAVMQWLRDELKVIKSSSESEHLIKAVVDTAGVYFVPAFTGLGAPYWDADARGVICGLTRGSRAGHIIRAALESIAYQAKDVFEVMKKESGQKILRIKVDGGACRNNFLMQFQADMLRAEVVRPRMMDSTVLGAAYLAGVSSGLYQTKDLDRFRGVDTVFIPHMPLKDVLRHYDGWLWAVEKSRSNDKLKR